MTTIFPKVQVPNRQVPFLKGNEENKVKLFTSKTAALTAKCNWRKQCEAVEDIEERFVHIGVLAQYGQPAIFILSSIVCLEKMSVTHFLKSVSDLLDAR